LQFIEYDAASVQFIEYDAASVHPNFHIELRNLAAIRALCDDLEDQLSRLSDALTHLPSLSTLSSLKDLADKIREIFSKIDLLAKPFSQPREAESQGPVVPEATATEITSASDSTVEVPRGSSDTKAQPANGVLVGEPQLAKLTEEAPAEQASTPVTVPEGNAQPSLHAREAELQGPVEPDATTAETALMSSSIAEAPRELSGGEPQPANGVLVIEPSLEGPSQKESAEDASPQVADVEKGSTQEPEFDGVLEEKFWSLVGDARLALAYQLGRVIVLPPVPPPVLCACVLGAALTEPAGQVARTLEEVLRDVAISSAETRREVTLLLAAGILKLALLAPRTSATALLRAQHLSSF
jgi:hypothetical protein